MGGWKRFYFIFLCAWLGCGKWRDGKLFCLVEKKNEKIENIVCKIYHHVSIR